MDENIPIEAGSDSRKKFEKTVKGIKKMLKSGKVDPVQQVETLVSEKEKSMNDKKKGKPRADRGVVYIGHIPHGFYEEQMRSYFSQFGKVTNVRVARSAKTGRSKGYAFVEFLKPEVAQIVAESMNNYLMDKRLLKAEYVPPEKQRPKYFKGMKWVPGKCCPGVFKRKQDAKNKNKKVTTQQWLKDSRKRINRLHKLKNILRSAGIDYDFFQPCDVPDKLADYDPAQPYQPKKQNAGDNANQTEEKSKKKKKLKEEVESNVNGIEKQGKKKKNDNSKNEKVITEVVRQDIKKNRKNLNDNKSVLSKIKETSEIVTKKQKKSKQTTVTDLNVLSPAKKQKKGTKLSQQSPKMEERLVSKKQNKEKKFNKKLELNDDTAIKMAKAIKENTKNKSSKHVVENSSKLLALKSKTIERKPQKKNIGKVNKRK